MGSDFCSAPASSVDAERSFSDGRREINFMQHNISSQTFKAEMAVGSWEGTPLFPDIDAAIRVLQQSMSRSSTINSSADN
ncbi:hypothetical protein DFH11DRAFT_1513652 [Phellopilus nigrolimitatus]|nr:hypothetical protein DFH11DRAFT_1513652 [Phellopilus nigrolimitatus]